MNHSRTVLVFPTKLIAGILAVVTVLIALGVFGSISLNRAGRLSRTGPGVVMAADDGKSDPQGITDRKPESTGSEVGNADSDDFRVISAAFSPDAKLLMISTDRQARLVEIASGATVRTFKGRSLGLSCAAYSFDGSRIATGANDMTATLWNAKTGALVRQLKGHSGDLTGVAFSRDGKHLVTGAYCDAEQGDISAIVWDAETGNKVAAIKGSRLPRGQVLHVAFAGDNEQAILGMNVYDVVLWQFKKGEIRILRQESRAPIPAAVAGCSVSAVADDVAASGRLEYKLAIWNTRSGERIHEFQGPDDLGEPTIALSPNGKLLLAGFVEKVAILWDAASGRRLHKFSCSDWVSTVAFSPDGTKIALGEFGGTITVWDVKSYVLIQTIRIIAGKISLLPSAEGKK